MNNLFYGDNLEVLRKKIPSETIDLCYIVVDETSSDT
jgi:hypothetical protein